MHYDNLAAARSQILGAGVESLARLAGLAEDRVREIEGGASASLAELAAIAEVMGLPSESLGDGAIEIEDAGIGALALVDEFTEISALTRSRVVRAAAAARDLAVLQEILGERDRWAAYLDWRPLPKCSSHLEPHQRGRHYASRLRKRLGVQGPISSMVEFVRSYFPDIAIIFADLGSPTLSGVSLADATRGPVIVLNTVGKNESALVRRFSLAHELCHLLIDKPKNSALAQLSGFKNHHERQVEQTANAFAIRLLLPESDLAACAKGVDDELALASHLMETYGVHYEALRLYLRNEAGLTLPIRPDSRLLRRDGIRSAWSMAEDRGQAAIELMGVPVERAGEVAAAAATAYSEDEISRGRFAEYLGVPRTAELDRILGHFGLEPPEWS